MISDHQKKPANSPKRHEEALKREKSSVMEDIEFGEVKEDEFDAATAKTTAQQRPRRAKKKRKALSVLLTCGIYSFCSVITVLTNKSLASGYNHLLKPQSPDTVDDDINLNLILVVAQALITILCVRFCKYIRLVDYPSFAIQTARKWVVVNLWFCAMLYTGICALQYNSVPMVIVYRNLTNILVTVGDYGLFAANSSRVRARESWGVIMAFFIMLSGAILASYSNESTSTKGLFWMVLNGITTAAYILSMKLQTVKLSKFGLVYYNHVMLILWLLPLSIWKGEWTILIKSPDLWHTLEYWLTMGFNGMVGFGLNFASLHCVAATGPTTYAIVGSFNKIPMVVLGYLWFEATTFSIATW
eukprot:CAMPEP_0194202772 /NCGR_PEP_ID=MMETSP0156-20130528/2710_1 /TAXON_ID=33649 /ORGANISM="Thalassionema nitzschioides, Strain L26-B" /LENGTH=358 /DNA_ID=CAMNT_0038928353 /DNA_START=193 /DNA_END=1266 /DNA_ORIENTATION=-